MTENKIFGFDIEIWSEYLRWHEDECRRITRKNERALDKRRKEVTELVELREKKRAEIRERNAKRHPLIRLFYEESEPRHTYDLRPGVVLEDVEEISQVNFYKWIHRNNIEKRVLKELKPILKAADILRKGKNVK